MITLNELKLYGDVTKDKDDELLENIIMPGYVGQIGKYCRQIFTFGTHTDKVKAFYDIHEGILNCYMPTPFIAEITEAHLVRPVITLLSEGIEADFEIDNRDDGAIISFYGIASLDKKRIFKTQITYEGGWDADTVPDDFKMALIRLIWWGYKLREAPLHKTAQPAFGSIIIPPSGWPRDIREVFKPYTRYV